MGSCAALIESISVLNPVQLIQLAAVAADGPSVCRFFASFHMCHTFTFLSDSFLKPQLYIFTAVSSFFSCDVSHTSNLNRAKENTLRMCPFLSCISHVLADLAVDVQRALGVSSELLGGKWQSYNKA